MSGASALILKGKAGGTNQDTIENYHPFSDVQRWRQEKRGRFPKRVKIGLRRVAWHRAEVLEWQADPQAWAAAHATEAASD